MPTNNDTIVAPATPPGRGGISIVRISGPGTQAIAAAVLGRLPTPRRAWFTKFLGAQEQPLDEGIALFYPGTGSFTGEDILELQGHGGPVVIDMLVSRVLELGARLARPGEFSERAFLNGKIDLVQAEAIADLIDSSTQTAARCALQSLAGKLSARVNEIVENVIALRTHVEAAIDFSDEEIDYFADSRVRDALKEIHRQLEELLRASRQGYLINTGLRVVLLGAPNVGKSSLLNRLSDSERAIVDAIPGTTRDVVEQSIQIDGLPIHLVDTAGLRDTNHTVESEGVRRARQAMADADHCLWVCDDSGRVDQTALPTEFPEGLPVTVVRNKIDLSGRAPGMIADRTPSEIAVSAATGAGVAALQERLRQSAGVQPAEETGFIARQRHLEAMQRASAHVQSGLEQPPQSGELVAEELRLTQQALAEITGAFTSEDLLGRIFSSFCIGK
ncbi:MAG: tRNA uridine-5-carboxymethylaminomethyl(34) synthesis GTPase MnmE [Gammaproteobacteria bacterium]|nr:tRNA uridine-5-carboxymethylaminomethyl(34) synthesis GTPase MnmE [Gammaproteobacteria bacterium]